MIEILYAFAVWRLTSLLYQEDGPRNIFEQIRKDMRYWTKGMECFWCLSLWVSIPFAIILEGNYPIWNVNLKHLLVYWLGLSGMAILINQVSDKLDV